jgi:uncharacterized phage infection (PIP) family protein YhgE
MIGLILVMAGQVLDYLSTSYAIRHGAYEANPLVAYVGLIPSKLLVCGMALFLLLIDPRRSFWLGLVAFLIGAVFSVNNFLVAH